MDDIKALQVFLASPGDLIQERKTARQAADDANKIVSRLNWQINLVLWEDLPHGGGRPQDRINPAVQSCDLFIGLLGRKWGEGFEEEYGIALERWKAGRCPEICLYFKDIDEKDRDDPGDSLRKVLEFRQRVEQEEEAFYKPLDPTNWRSQLSTRLSQFVIDRHEDAAAVRSPNTPPSLGSEPSRPTSKADDNPEHLEQQRAAVHKILEAMTATTSDVDLASCTRAFFLLSSWFSEAYSGDLAEMHSLNLLYRQRTVKELSEKELHLVIRSCVSLAGASLPGWFWMRPKPGGTLYVYLAYIALFDSTPDVRRGALVLLRAAPTEALSEVPTEMLRNLFTDKDGAVLEEAIRFFESRGDLLTPEVLDSFLVSESWGVKKEAVRIRAKSLLPDSPTTALEMVVDGYLDPSPELVQLLEQTSAEFGDEALDTALTKGTASTRLLVAKYIKRKGQRTASFWGDFLEDKDELVRVVAIDAALDSGETLDLPLVAKLLPNQEAEAERIVDRILAKEDPHDLMQRIDWLGDGREIYRFLATHNFNLIKDRLRTDLADGFESLDLSSTVAPNKEALRRFVVATFVQAALTGLVENGVPSDIEFGRRYLGQTLYGLADAMAIALVSRMAGLCRATVPLVHY